MAGPRPGEADPPVAARAAATVGEMEEAQRRAHALMGELHCLLERTAIRQGSGEKGQGDVANSRDATYAAAVVEETPGHAHLSNEATAVRGLPNSINGLRPLYKRIETEMRGHARALDGFKARFAGILVTDDLAVSTVPSTESPSPATEGGALEEELEAAEKRLRGRLDCSNLPSAEAQWAIIKRCRDLKAVGQKFERPGKTDGKQSNQAKRGKASKEVSLVDAVVDGGERWLRVLGTTESRLLQEMAEAGWDWGGDDQGDDAGGLEATDNGDADSDDDDMETISLVQTVQGMIQAAMGQGHGNRPHTLHIVLTRIRQDSNPEIACLLDRVRRLNTGSSQADVAGALSVIIDAADSPFCASPPPPLQAALHNLAPPPPARDALGRAVSVGAVANLDASTLMALVSDISHARISEQPWHRADIRKQVRAELSGGGGGEPTVASFLYPLLAGRELVCALGAARRVRDIVATLGTGGEPARAAALLGSCGAEEAREQEQEQEQRGEEARRALQQCSIHPVPSGLRLPIRIVDARMAARWEGLVEAGALPAVAGAVAGELLNEVNLESFLYGWEAGVTTVTANQTLSQQIIKRVRDDRGHSPSGAAGGPDGGGTWGPQLYVHTVRRSLGAGQQGARGVVPGPAAKSGSGQLD